MPKYSRTFFYNAHIHYAATRKHSNGAIEITSDTDPINLVNVPSDIRKEIMKKMDVTEDQVEIKQLTPLD